MDLKGTKSTWIGRGTFRFVTTEGKIVLVDPWVMNNPACPATPAMRRAVGSCTMPRYPSRAATAVRKRGELYFPALTGAFAHIQPVSHWGINE